MTVTIRDGGGADDAVCGRILGASAGASVHAERLPHARALFEDTTPLALDGRLRLIAEIDGNPVGFADFTAAKGHVKFLFVTPEAQGSGAGSALLDAIQARVDGPISVHVLSVNDAGVLWYLGRGFRIVDGWAEIFQGETAAWLRMVRDPR